MMAELILGPRAAAPESVGDISLWPHQREAVGRLRAAIEEFGGALLADDVGTGKTFVALAVAADYGAPLVVAPAALRDRWRDAASRVGRAMTFASFESLSRGPSPCSGHDFVIVDEAHHARNPAAKRYGTLASLVANVPALLLTATPIHNKRDDLLALLALFCGSASASLDDAALARCVVRRGREVLGAAASLPAIRGPIPLVCAPASDDTVTAIMALPPAVPAADAGIASALLAISLLRQWSSSQGALLAAIRRRLAAAHALASTLDAGHYPTRGELAAWTTDDDAQQVVMTALFASAGAPPATTTLRAAIAAHIDGLRALRRAAVADHSLDLRRARALADVRAAHGRERVIAFSQFAGTIGSYWRELRHLAGVCALTAERGRVASGAISRAEALGSFTPGAPAVRARAFDIDTLLVTDLASEGLDLQRASVLVHLDLPWTPARLEQRVGRIVRPGSPHDVVHVYAMEPPPGAAAILDIRRTLSAKLAAARATLGFVMPELGVALDAGAGRASQRSGIPDAAEAARRLLERWRVPVEADNRGGDRRPAVAVASSNAPGWLAVVGDDEPRLIASLSGATGDDPALIERAVTLVGGAAPLEDTADREAALTAIDRALAEIAAWMDSRRAAALAGVDDLALVRGRRRALAAVGRLASAPASSRALAATAARRALAFAARPLGASRERELREITARTDGTRDEDRAMVDAMARLAATAAPRTGREATLRALVVLVPGR